MQSESMKDREIQVTRLIDAPRDLVFAAFTEQKHAEKWWIPDGTTQEWREGEGGVWRFSQPGPRAGEMPFKVEFVEITRPDRFVYDFSPDMDAAPEPTRTTVTFEEEDGKTRVTLQLLFPSAAALEHAAKFGASKGAELALKNLADYLAK